jgi:histone H3/H4
LKLNCLDLGRISGELKLTYSLAKSRRAFLKMAKVVQETPDLCIPMATFKHEVKQLTDSGNEWMSAAPIGVASFRWKREAIKALQVSAEQFLTDFFSSTYTQTFYNFDNTNNL